ncbi:DUF3486 family protein [Desulforegula conservatrix]|uniref:DUF3486 family protein n=1 Tax=Desulforegula conservatrix TaxID=153026 RepID=UPI00041C7319|nr:DUF3486 family protein [Desulforegula conservatrix]
MPSPSGVEKLPKEIKEWLDITLVDSNFSGYKQLEEELRERGFQISKSAIHRYGQNFEKRLSVVKMATEQAKAIVENTSDDEGAMSEALMRLVQEKIFTVLMDFEPDSEKPIKLDSLAKAVAELGRASVTQKKYAAEVRKKTEETAASVVQTARKGGLSDETVEQIKRQILGIAS